MIPFSFQSQKISSLYSLRLYPTAVFPSRAKGGPEGADRGKAHLNDVRFNSNWVFFTHDDCLKIDIQYQKSLKIPKFGLTEGVTFNSENGKLSWWQKWWYRQISEMSGENSKKFFSIASCGLLPTLKKKFWNFLCPSQIFANCPIFMPNSTCSFQNWI